MQTKKYENLIFYLDLSGSFLKKKDLIKNLTLFIDEKKKRNQNTKFNILFINKDGTPNFLEESNDNSESSLLEKFEKEWNDKERPQSFLENGLFFALSYIAEKSRNKQSDYRIIVISDCPSSKSEEYSEALFKLIDNVKYFPTYIDIIRIGKERFYSDDVKLRIITATTNGGLFYIEDPKELRSILFRLVQSKNLLDLNQPDGKIEINNENKLFFENLASDLLTPEPSEENEDSSCFLCNKKENSEIAIEYSNFLKCFNCGKLFHEECLSKFAYKNNIGICYIFRCPNCEILLKLEETRVLKINGISLENQNIEQTSVYTTNNEINIDQKEPNSNPDISNRNVDENKPKRIPISHGGFDFFVSITPKTNQGSVEETKTSPENESKEIPSKVTDNTQTPNQEIKSQIKRKKTTIIKFCPVCGANLSAGDKICRICKTKL